MSHFSIWCTFFVFNSTWQFALLIATTALLVRLSPKAANGLQYRLWVSCLVLAVTLPLLSTYLAVVPVHSSTAASQSDDTNRWKVPRPAEHGRLTLRLTEVPVTSGHWDVFGLVAAFYGACLAFGLARILLRLEKTRRIVARKTPWTRSTSGFDVLQNSLDTDRRSVKVFASLDVKGPATVNWPSPIVLLPPEFEVLAETERAAVMAHELAHVQRRDFKTNLLLEVVSAALAYHPATPWLKRRIAECREAMCDEMAAQATFGRTKYARCLLDVAQRTAPQGSLWAGLTLGISDTELEGRIMKLVHAPLAMSTRRRSLLHVLCLLTLAFSSVGVLCFSLHPTSVQAAGVPAFPFDPSQTFDTLIPKAHRKPAPDFTLVDNSGKTITLSNYKGKVVLLDFWATWCGGCKLEIPWYMEFDRKYRKDGLAVIGVSMDDKGWEAVRPFLAKKRDDETGGMIAMQYPIVIGNDALGGRFGLTSMPMTLLIDKDGKIAVSHTGVVDKANFEGNLRELLK